MTIENKKNQPLNIATGTIPQVSGAMANWFQPLSFVRVQKQTTAFQVVETLTPVAFQGVVQFQRSSLELESHGQRNWEKVFIYALPSLILNVDEIIEYQSVRYRIMGLKKYDIYGYIFYDLVQDWEEIPSPIVFPISHTVLQFGMTMRGLAA